MNKDQSSEYLAAFLIGTLLGAGAALLLAPEPPTRREKLMKELKPYRKKLNKRTKGARKEMSRRASAAGDYGDELVATGREVLTDLRSELASLVADARHEIAATLETQLEAAQDAIRKGAKRVRS